MHFLRRNRSVTGCSVMMVAATAGASSLLGLHSAYGQQNPYDLTIFHSSTSDSNYPTTTFNSGSDGSNPSAEYWLASTSTYSIVNPSTGNFTNPASVAASTAPQAGYAYVDNGNYQVRTSSTSTNTIFNGDSLTIIPATPPTAASILSGSPASGLFIKSPTNSTVTVGNLVLANGGALVNFNNQNPIVNGGIYLVAAGTTLDGITTTVSGGLFDSRVNTQGMTVNSNISGPGQLHIIQSGGNVDTSFITLDGSNTFSGGVNLDSSIYSVNLPSPYPRLNINSPTALGTGTFVITDSSAGGPEFDNTTGSAEVLTTNNAMAWNASSFTFLGTSSLDMGSGPVALSANVTLTTAASTLSLEGAISGAYGLTKAGSGTLLLNGKSTYTGGTTVTGGTLGGLGTVPGPLIVSSGASLAPGTAVLGELTDAGALNLSSSSILDIELGSGTSDEVVSLTGGVTLTGSVLDITLAPGYTPSVGSVFTIIDNQSSLATTGTFSDVTGGYVTDALGDTYSVNYGAAVDGDSVANDVQLTFVSPVPEPTSLGLLGLAAVSMLGRRRRR